MNHPTERSFGFFLERDAQSRAKHEVLRRYAGGWSGIILSGLRSRVERQLLPRDFAVHLVYVDGFAGAGRYQRDRHMGFPTTDDDPIWGSPVIGLRVLEEQARAFAGTLSVTTSAVFVEQDERCYNSLVDALELSPVEARVIAADHVPPEAPHGSALVVRGDFREHIDEILRWAGSDAYILALIDPFGPSMDLRSMGRILKRQKTDTIALFPYDDLKRRGGSARKPEDDWGPSDRGNIKRFDEHFGTPKWREIYAREGLTAEEKEKAFVDLYTEQLKRLDPRNSIKTIGLRYASKDERTAYYLCMTTRNAYGAVKLNDVILEVAAAEDLEIWRDREGVIRRMEATTGQGGLFDEVGGIPDEAPVVEKPKADPADVERVLIERATSGSPMPYREVLTRMAESIFTDSDIQKALRRLRRSGRAEFDGSQIRATTPVWIKPGPGAK